MFIVIQYGHQYDKYLPCLRMMLVLLVNHTSNIQVVIITNNTNMPYYHQPHPPHVVPPMTGGYPSPDPHQVVYVNLFNGFHTYPFLSIHTHILSLFHYIVWSSLSTTTMTNSLYKLLLFSQSLCCLDNLVNNSCDAISYMCSYMLNKCNDIIICVN